MSGILEGLAAHLADLGLGTWSTGDPYTAGDVAIVCGAMPSSPDQVIALSGYPSTPAQGSSNEAEVIERIEIRVRGTTDESVSRDRCTGIADGLDGTGHLPLPNGVLVLNIVVQQTGPLYQGTDANDRHEHTTLIQVEYLRPSQLRPAPE